jgi:hypothetical protein
MDPRCKSHGDSNLGPTSKALIDRVKDGRLTVPQRNKAT